MVARGKDSIASARLAWGKDAAWKGRSGIGGGRHRRVEFSRRGGGSRLRRKHRFEWVMLMCCERGCLDDRATFSQGCMTGSTSMMGFMEYQELVRYTLGSPESIELGVTFGADPSYRTGRVE